MFDVTISGFEEIIKGLEKIQYDLTEDGLNEFCDKIKKEAYETCGLTDKELTLNATKVGDKISIAFKLKEGKEFECVKKSIEKIIPDMSLMTKPLFESIIIQMGKQTIVEDYSTK